MSGMNWDRANVQNRQRARERERDRELEALAPAPSAFRGEREWTPESSEAFDYALTYDGTFPFMLEMKTMGQKPGWIPSDAQAQAILNCKYRRKTRPRTHTRRTRVFNALPCAPHLQGGRRTRLARTLNVHWRSSHMTDFALQSLRRVLDSHPGEDDVVVRTGSVAVRLGVVVDATSHDLRRAVRVVTDPAVTIWVHDDSVEPLPIRASS